MTVEDGTVIYRRAIGRTVRCPRSEIGWIDRVIGQRGPVTIRFAHDNGSKAFTVDQYFARADMEELAKRIGVPLHWRE